MWWLFVILVMALLADICGIYQLVEIAKKKGHYLDGAGALWLIGLFGTLFMLVFIVIALPDWSDRVPHTSKADALPEV